MVLFMLHTLLTPLSQFAHDIKSWRHKLKKHLLAAIPPFYGAGMGTDRTTVQQNIEKALENGNFAFHSYDVTVCFFFSFSSSYGTTGSLALVHCSILQLQPRFFTPSAYRHCILHPGCHMKIRGRSYSPLLLKRFHTP